MKFIHTADIHIDQPFSGIHSDHGDIKHLLKTSNQQILTKIVDTCIEKKVDFLLVVGDTFHQNQPSIHTQKFVMEEFERLGRENIKVVMSFGNHDYYTENRYWFEWPDNVILFKKEEVQTKTLVLKNGDSVAISGFSYENKWIKESKVQEFPKRSIDTTYHIGFYHGDDSPQYAPFNYGDLPTSYEYWALGHIHKSSVLSDRPLIVYPGTPQGHTKKEYQVKGIVYVDIDRGSREIEWLDISNIRWHKKEFNIEEDLERKEILERLEKHILAQIYQHPFNVVSLNVTTTADNAREILKEQEEILLYLQDKIFKASENRCWLQNLSLSQVTSDKLIMGFETTLIDDLGRVYQHKDNFENVVADLLNQPAIASNLAWDTAEIEELVTESSQLIKDKMIFKNGEE
ncbi:exonuclease SbcCD subunit D [Vagococcus fluvialis]|uniref:metallophosphoesterase family protein n=1 Tax=Vagococcus fluvialis TaxID=2738 RepID=UPI002B2DA5BF|nr:DNA repair exonuclease [Vagococcus fluvialis]